MTIKDSTLSGNEGCLGGGVINTGKVSLSGSTQVVNNVAANSYGGGIYSTTNSVTFDGTNVALKSNKAHYPSSSEPAWYQGRGVYLDERRPNHNWRFNPSTQVGGDAWIALDWLRFL